MANCSYAGMAAKQICAYAYGCSKIVLYKMGRSKSRRGCVGSTHFFEPSGGIIRFLFSDCNRPVSYTHLAQYFHVPVVFAKKTKTKNIAGDVYTSRVESYTHGRVYDIIVSKDFLGPEDKVLLIDDFLANGKALEGLAQLVQDAGATLVGAGIIIEKGFQRRCV